MREARNNASRPSTMPRAYSGVVSNYSCHCRLYASMPCRSKPSRSEEHTSELQSLMRSSYAVFCLKKKKTTSTDTNTQRHTLIQQTDNTHIAHHIRTNNLT